MSRRALYFNLEEDKKIACTAGIVERVSPKSCFFQLSSHFQTEELEGAVYELNRVIRGYKRIVEDIVKDKRFRDKFISALDLPQSFKETGKAYVTLEFTIFFNKVFEVKEVREFLNELYVKFKEYINTIKTFHIKSKIPYVKKKNDICGLHYCLLDDDGFCEQCLNQKNI